MSTNTISHKWTGFLGETAESGSQAGNTQDELGTCCQNRKQGNKISKTTKSWHKGSGTDLKRLPVAKMGGTMYHNDNNGNDLKHIKYV